MRYFVKEWDDTTASLIAEDGYILETYESTETAVDNCIRHCCIEPDFVEKLIDRESSSYVELKHRCC